MKNNKGITMIALSLTIIILVLLTGVTVSYTSKQIEAKNLNKMYSDIDVLSAKVTEYYLKNGKLPVFENSEDTYNMAMRGKFGDNWYNINDINPPDTNNFSPNYYTINLGLLDNVTLNYGKDNLKWDDEVATIDRGVLTDVYIINEVTHQIYYVNGVKVKGELYYTRFSEKEITKKLSFDELTPEWSFTASNISKRIVSENKISLKTDITINGLYDSTNLNSLEYAWVENENEEEENIVFTKFSPNKPIDVSNRIANATITSKGFDSSISNVYLWIRTMDSNGNLSYNNAEINILTASNLANDTPTGIELGKFQTKNNKAYYYTGSTPESGTEITASNMGQFLGMKVNYTPGGYLTIGSTTVGQGGNYRVFYIDVGGKYGKAGTIYLKAEEDSNKAGLGSITDPQVSDIATNFNKEWTGSTYASSPAESMRYVNKLLNKKIWEVYKDTAGIANYVIGAPDLEMWVDGYNKFLTANPIKDNNNQDLYFSHNYTVTQDTTNGPTGANKGKGYYIGINNAYGNNNGYRTANSTMVNSSSYASGSAADRVKAWNNGGNYWLASPSAFDTLNVMIVYGNSRVRPLDVDERTVRYVTFTSSYAFCPLVSCNSGVAISEAQ